MHVLKSTPTSYQSRFGLSRFAKTVAFVAFALLVSACDQTQKSTAKMAQTHQADNEGTQSGKALYLANCASCHRENGHGMFLKGIPANAHTELDVSEIVRLISVGHSDKSAMPTFPHLTRQQTYAIGAYVKQLEVEAH